MTEPCFLSVSASCVRALANNVDFIHEKEKQRTKAKTSWPFYIVIKALSRNHKWLNEHLVAVKAIALEPKGNRKKTYFGRLIEWSTQWPNFGNRRAKVQSKKAASSWVVSPTHCRPSKWAAIVQPVKPMHRFCQLTKKNISLQIDRREQSVRQNENFLRNPVKQAKRTTPGVSYSRH